MKNKLRKIKSFIIIIALLFTFVSTDCFFVDDASADSIAVVSTSNGANIRSGPGTNYSSVGIAPYKTQVTVLDTAYASDNVTRWLKIQTPLGIVGYIRADLLSEVKKNEYIEDEIFEAKLTAEGFPESYKPYLRALHANYPEWEFVAQQTGLDWNEVIKAESKVGNTLVESSSIASWKSTEYPAYNSETGKWKSYDSGGWNSASKAIIEYYMDPRNFLSSVGIFQFLSLYYDEATQTREGLVNVVASTFMSDDKVYDPEYFGGEYTSYVDVLMNAGKTNNVNPYVLAAMIIVEQGTKGTGGSISGTQSNYEGLYNFFNIRAYKSGSYSAVQYGLLYAGALDESTYRPWNTRVKSIFGGASIYAKRYVLSNQNTLYLKKWNVLNGLSMVGEDEYMTNVQGAESEASSLRKAYAQTLEQSYTFCIPVYSNMPETACAKPTGTTVVLDSEDEISTEVQLSEEEKKALEEEQKAQAEKLLEEQKKAQELLEKWDRFNHLKEMVEQSTVELSSEKRSKGIKLFWKKSAGYKVDYYEVFRSTKKSSGYTNTPIFTRTDITKCEYYNNKSLVKGTKYYYKVRGVRLLENPDGEIVKVYTQWSNKTYRTFK